MSDPFSIVRQAHRICAAYYQQVFPMINETAQKLEATFVHWEPESFLKPPQKNKNPLETWKWNYLPIIDISFVFSRQLEPGTFMSRDDFVIDFRLVTDSELSYEQRSKQYGENEEPIVFELKVSVEDSKSYLCVYLFSVASDNDIYDSPYTLWCRSNYPEVDSTVLLSDSGCIKSIRFMLPLSEIALDNGSELLVEKIQVHLEKLQCYKIEECS